MTFTIYDTRQRKLVPFQPLHDAKVSIYNCGPTVYSDAHIGNFRAFMLADLLRRYFEWKGFEVRQVMNITDVGHLTEDDRADAAGQDKLQQKAAELGWDPYRVARYFEERFHEDRKALAIQDAHFYPRATEHICEMLVQIQQLLDRGHAYLPDSGGDVYFSVSSFPEYGALTGKSVDELIAGARVEVNTDKRNPADFALWKVDPGHLMQWDPHDDGLWKSYSGARPKLDPRIGRGFPGWHIECSAMAMRYLGQTFDIHTGGEDNAFPHHECEIAQAKGAVGSEFSRYWMHNRHLMVEGGKMSKSAGTLYRLADIVEKGYTPVELRYALLSNHYRQPMNFTFDGLVAARSSIQRLQNTRNRLAELSAEESSDAPNPQAVSLAERLNADFGAALDDDLNISNALGALFAFTAEANKRSWSPASARHLLAALERADHITAVLRDESSKTGCVSPEALAETTVSDARIQQLLEAELTRESVELLVCARYQARKSKNWSVADAIRDRLKQQGVTIEDLPEGTRFKLP